MNQFICEEEETTTVNIIGWFYHSSKVKFMKLNKFKKKTTHEKYIVLVIMKQKNCWRFLIGFVLLDL
jgi:hypothetical protein